MNRPAHNHAPEEDEKSATCPRCILNRAAPDPLDALKTALRIIENESCGNWKSGVEGEYFSAHLTAHQANVICSAALEAIAKAEG